MAIVFTQLARHTVVPFLSNNHLLLLAHHEAISCHPSFFSLAHASRNGSCSTSPQQLLLPGMTLDAASPVAQSLRAYIKDQPDPEATSRLAQAFSSGSLQPQVEGLHALLASPRSGDASLTQRPAKKGQVQRSGDDGLPGAGGGQRLQAPICMGAEDGGCSAVMQRIEVLTVAAQQLEQLQPGLSLGGGAHQGECTLQTSAVVLMTTCRKGREPKEAVEIPSAILTGRKGQSQHRLRALR